MIADFNTDNNFWDTYPDMKSMEPFKSLHKADKSKKKHDSSWMMWAIALVESTGSNWFYLPDKYERVASDHLATPDIDWDLYETHILQFRATQMTQAERSLSDWNLMMAKRDRYLKSKDYHFDEQIDEFDSEGEVIGTTFEKGTAEALDKAFSTTPKMYADYEKIKKVLDEERTIIQNSDNKSLGDQGQI